jgi:CHAD domain-containing protein
MRHLVDAWFTAAEADLSDTHRLHLFRIAGKRLRYAMEIFSAALGSNCRKELYPRVEGILEQLGQINDHVTSEARFQVWLHETEQPDQRTLLMRLLSSDARAITNGLHGFFQLWNAEHRNALRARFDHELADS